MLSSGGGTCSSAGFGNTQLAVMRRVAVNASMTSLCPHKGCARPLGLMLRIEI